MAAERAILDVNKHPAMLGVTNDANLFPTNLRVDSSTLRLLVDAAITSGSVSLTNPTIGAAVPATANYESINVGGTLRGSTGVNPSGTVYAQQVDLASFGGTTVTLGQQTAANSIPVILPSATITTLTPPAAIAGFALDTSLTTIDTDIKANITLHAGTNLIGKVGIDQTTPGTTNLVALTAETTKVIGVTRTADGAGNLLTTNSTTFTAKFGLDANLLGTLGTAFSTAGKVDVKAADGDVFVRSNAASTFPTQATLQTQTDTVMVGGVNIKEINAIAVLMGNGVTGTGSQRVTIASDNTAFNIIPTPSVAGATGWQFKQFGDGTVGTDWNGAKQQIVGSAATFGGYVWIFNPNTATSFIQIFNKTSANVTLGTTVPDMVIPIPGIAAASATGAAANNEIMQGVKFSTGLTMAITTTVGGLTAPVSKCYGCILYN